MDALPADVLDLIVLALAERGAILCMVSRALAESGRRLSRHACTRPVPLYVAFESVNLLHFCVSQTSAGPRCASAGLSLADAPDAERALARVRWKPRGSGGRGALVRAS